MNVLVNGIGNIGTTLLNLLVDHKEKLEISTLYAHKNTNISAWNHAEIAILVAKGIKICTKHKYQYLDIEAIWPQIDYVFDCTSNGFGLKNKKIYDKLPNLIGASAQGSEKGFGTPYMFGVNNTILKDQKYANIVSCNTHSLTSILQTACNGRYSDIEHSDFVIVRRSEDIGNHQRLVSANVVSRHLNEEIGTHHAIDVKDLLKTININTTIQSSDITTPSQLMHSVRFNIKFKEESDLGLFEKRIKNNPFLAVSAKFDSNIIFELGRRYSSYGRLFSHAIIISNNLLFNYTTKEIKGWAFIPQEGNTLVSTINAYLIQCDIQNRENKITHITKTLLRNEW